LYPVILHGFVSPDPPTNANCRRSRVTGARLVRISGNSSELIFLFLGSFGGEVCIEGEGRLKREREFFIDNLLVRIHFIVMIG
jgi:hypothetical protein